MNPGESNRWPRYRLLVSSGNRKAGPGRCQVKVNIAFRMATFAVEVTLGNSRYSSVENGPSGVIVGRSPLCSGQNGAGLFSMSNEGVDRADIPYLSIGHGRIFCP